MISSIYLNPSTKFRRVRIDIIMYVIVLFWEEKVVKDRVIPFMCVYVSTYVCMYGKRDFFESLTFEGRNLYISDTYLSLFLWSL